MLEGRKAARLYETFKNKVFSSQPLLLLPGVPICSDEILMNLVDSTIILEPVLFEIRIFVYFGYVDLPVCQSLTYSSFNDYVGKAIHVNPNQFYLYVNIKYIDSDQWSQLNHRTSPTPLTLHFTNETANIQCTIPKNAWVSNFLTSSTDQIPTTFPATAGDIVSYMSLKHDIPLENIDFSKLNLTDPLVKNKPYSIQYSESPKPKITKFCLPFYLEPTSEVVALPLPSNFNFYFVAMMLCDRLKCNFSQIFFSLNDKNNQRISKSDLVYQYFKELISTEVISVDFESTVYITWIDLSTQNPLNLQLFFTSQETVRDLKMTIIKQMNIHDLDPSYILIREIKTKYEYPDLKQKFLETMTKEKKIGKDVKLTDLLFEDNYRKELQDTLLIIDIHTGSVWAKLKKNDVTSKQIQYQLQSSILTKKMTVSSTDSIESIQHAIEVENHLMDIPYDFRSYSSSNYCITFKNLATNIEFQLLDDLKVQIENASHMNLDR